MGRIPAAQCPSCESQAFQPTGPQVFACTGCGAEIHHDHLVSQVARSACLNAAVLAHQLQHLRRSLN